MDTPSIKVNDVDITWNVEDGTFTFFGIPSALFWINPSMLTMLQPLAKEVGHDLFRLQVAQSASKGTDEDYHAMVTVLGDTFEAGFLKWGAAVSSAGWGTFELLDYDADGKKARVRVSNTWELLMQKDISDRWGCPFIQGKIIGIFSHALKTTCWADELTISYAPDNAFVEFDIYESRKTIEAEIQRKRMERMQENERLLAAEIARKTAELEAANRLLEEKADALSQSNAELQRFAYVASHDMQEPLRTVISYLQILESRYGDQLDDNGKEFIGFAVGGARRMRTLLRDLLQFSRIEMDGLKMAEVDMNTITDTALQDLAASITHAKATITVDDLPRVKGDGGQLRALLTNLVGNAIKYSDPARPPEIAIHTRRTGDHWRFTVSDNGIGIEEQYFDRIFVIFQRLHGHGEYEGTGIGLAVCKKIVEKHGGWIRVDSAPGNGSTFSFTLPATDTGPSDPTH